MNKTTASPYNIVGGFAVAGVTLWLGFYFAFVAQGAAGDALLRILGLIAGLIVLKFTFEFGRLRGFPVRKDDGSVSISNLLRNLVMAAIAWGGVMFAVAPFMPLALNLSQ